jgi:hypothetical protein
MDIRFVGLFSRVPLLRRYTHILNGLAIVGGLLCGSPESARAAAMEFRIGSSGSTDGLQWIVADGEIDQDTPEKFANFLRRHGPVSNINNRTEVWLNSPGGNLYAGLRLGKLIRENGLGTVVRKSVPRPGSSPQMEDEAAGRCESACAYTFLGGLWRSADDGTLGVHQFYTTDALSAPAEKRYTGEDLFDEQRIVGDLAAYVVKMGVDARFLVKASATAPTGPLYYFSSDEMIAFDITLNDKKFSPWALEEYRGGVIAFSRRKDTKVTATIFCRRDRILKLMITMPYLLPFPDPSEFIKGLFFSAFGEDLNNDDLTNRLSNGNLMIEARLPPIERIDGSPKGFYAAGFTGVGTLFDQDISGRDLARHVRIVQRNCL